MAESSALKMALPTALAMLAFTTNSILNQVTLVYGEADALTYAGVRLASGALMLAIVPAAMARFRDGIGSAAAWWRAGTLRLCDRLFLCLSGTRRRNRALLLFASVQIGMLGWAIGKGDRPGAFEWLGFGVAILFLTLLLCRCLTRPIQSVPL